MPIKPLREMPELLDHLIERFLTAINQRRAVPLKLSDDVMNRLSAYQYPGNVRELANLLQQISVLGDADEEMPRRLQVVDAGGTDRPPSARPAGTLKERTAAFEADVIAAAIKEFGSKRKAAAALGVDIGTIVRKTSRK
jgi:transcriptional regulator with PAS, ATPase and Fis domain